MYLTYFNPHHPRGWRRGTATISGAQDIISIHTTLAGGDKRRKATHTGLFQFQSTPPSRVATNTTSDTTISNTISIHTTLAGGDAASAAQAAQNTAFQSTPPSRVATSASMRKDSKFNDFNPHHPRGWRPPPRQPGAGKERNFNPHHPRGWRRVLRNVPIDQNYNFNPHHPRGWRPRLGDLSQGSADISIHTTLAGGDYYVGDIYK